jgi:hypothetical protein
LEQDEFGYVVKRADEDSDPGMIGDRVVSDIIHAELVVADLTSLNPNTFYELGIRHATEQPAIHIAKSGTQLPFDNISHRTIFVDLTDWHSIEAARRRLADSARAIRDPSFKVSNPITQANASFQMRQSEDPQERVIAEFGERLSALELSLKEDRVASSPVPNVDDRELRMETLGRKLMKHVRECKADGRPVELEVIHSFVREAKTDPTEKWSFKHDRLGNLRISTPDGSLTVSDKKYEWDEIPF